jgi:hypothetical protein
MEEKKRELKGNSNNNTRGTRQEKGQGSLNGAEPNGMQKTIIMDDLFGTFFALFIVMSPCC